jgi:hypothetical protein
MTKTVAVPMTNNKVSAMEMVIGLVKSGVPIEIIAIAETLTEDERAEVRERTA